MHITGVKPEDLDILVEIEYECFPASVATTKEDFIERLEKSPYEFWIMRDSKNNNRIASFLSGIRSNKPNLSNSAYHDISEHDPNGSWQMLLDLNTTEKYRHKGYAADVMKQAIDDIREREMKGVILDCRDYLVEYYKSLGFNEDGISETSLGGETWYQMKITF